MLKAQIDRDLKTALLAGNSVEVSVLRSLKSAVLYAEVAQGVKDAGLADDAVRAVLGKEAKKRQESADLFAKGGKPDRAKAELEEKAIIGRYLPAALSEQEIQRLIDNAAQELGEVSPQTMGKVIAHVKQASQGAADGGTVARLVKERM